jgi:subtilisin family serine protease
MKLKDNAYEGTVENDPKVSSVKPVFEHLTSLNEKSRSTVLARGLDRIRLVEFEQSVSLDSMIQRYRDDPNVEYVQPNFLYEPDLVPNDPLYSQQYAHQLSQAEAAWDLCTGSPDVVIAVIGTGVAIDNPDLISNVWINPGEIAGNNLDDDNNGYPDDVNGWNFENDNNNPRPASSNHETMVAGIVAARGNNGIGICGVSWYSSIMPLRAAYTSDQVAAAIEYARENGARIIHMSFGNYDRSKYGDGVVKEMLDDAYAAGVLLVATAGNDQKDWKRYPAALYNVLAVGATDRYDRRAVWGYYYSHGGTNFGPWVDLSASGSDILSTTQTGYATGDGTSYSAPYVSGLGALLFSYDGNLSNMAVRAILENTTDSINIDTIYHSVGTGRVNAWQALYNASTAYPLGEIVSPENKGFVPVNSQQVPLVFLAQGDTYRIEYSAFAGDQWTLIAQGDPEQDTQPDGLVHLAFANPGLGSYTLRLKVSRSGYDHVDEKLFAIDGGYQKNWPLTVSENKRYLRSNAICMDIDEDGSNEIIQSTYADSITNGYTYIWNEDGSNLPGWPKYLGGDPSCSTSAVGDVDGDGDYEVVTTTYRGGFVYVWHWQDGELLSGDWPKNFGRHIRANPLLADLDGDGDSEIIVAVSGHETPYGIFAFQHDGALVWEFPTNNVQAPMAAADLDGDGDIEIVVTATYYDTYLLDHEGGLVNQWSGGSHKGPVIVDLNKDGVLEIVNVSDSEKKLRALHMDGTALWEVPLGTSTLRGYGAISVGDLTGDGYYDIFIANGYGYKAYNKVYAWDHTGNPQRRRCQRSPCRFYI